MLVFQVVTMLQQQANDVILVPRRKRLVNNTVKAIWTLLKERIYLNFL